MEETPTIYEWAGGRAAFRAWLERFYDLVEEDELLAPAFGGIVSRQHRDHVLDWWCEVMGGRPPTPSSAAATRRCSPTTATWPSAPSSGCAS